MNRIMIIDSDLNQMKQLRDALKDDYLILGCNRGAKAMDLFRVFQPSALVVDPDTHELKGPEFIKTVRSLPYRGNIPILALSRLTTLRRIEESFAWGVDMIYSKPCLPERIKKKLNKLLAPPLRGLELSKV